MSAFHVVGDFPMLIAGPSFQNNATNRAKIRTSHAFDKYVLNIITKCESVIAGVIFETLNNAGVFQANIDPQAAIADTRTAVHDSHGMPDCAKAMAAATELKSERFVDMNNSMKDRLREALAPCDILSPA
ncbi:hypothetical protein ACOTCG_06980 [Achromobacter xylosoxidans]